MQSSVRVRGTPASYQRSLQMPVLGHGPNEESCQAVNKFAACLPGAHGWLSPVLMLCAALEESCVMRSLWFL